MSEKSTQYEDALAFTQNAFEEEYSDYAGTVSYLTGKQADQVAYWASQGMSYMPTPPDAPVDNFFDNASAYLASVYRSVVGGTVDEGLKGVIQVLDDTKPTSQGTKFGDLIGRVLSGDKAAIFGSAAEVGVLAKSLVHFDLTVTATVAAIEAITSQDQLDGAARAHVQVGGYILGAQWGGAIGSFLGPHGKIGGMALGSLAGYLFSTDFYDNKMAPIIEAAIQNAQSVGDTIDEVLDEIGDYLDGIWEQDGQAAQELWGEFVDEIGDLQGDINAMDTEPPVTAAV